MLGLIHLIAKLSSSIQKRILGGLRQAFPDQSEEWIQSIYKENLKVYARMAVDFEETPRMTDEHKEKKFTYEPSKVEYEKVCKDGGILILGHLGNWECNGIAITRLLETNRLHVLAKRQSNPISNNWIEKVRASFNAFLIYTDESPRIILSLLKKGDLVAFIADQDAGKNGMFLPFLGKLASTFLGPAVFARNTKVPVHFMWSRYNDDGTMVMGVQKIERPNLDPKKDSEEWEREFTYNWVSILEEKVKIHPSSYFWLHRRWKRQPADPDSVWRFWKDWKSKRNLT